jgi:hypothetical protein
VTDFIRDVKETDLGIEGKVYWKLFDRYIRLHNFDRARPEYMQSCAVALNSLDDRIIDELCKASLRYREDFLYAVGDECPIISNPREVLKIIKPLNLSIPFERRLDVPVVDLEFDCEWEEEHGMQWLVREGKILFVGAACSAIPWGEEDQHSQWNYA